MKVAVVMQSDFADAAEFLAEVRALEAAGVEMIGVDGGGSEALLGAVAAVTHRVGLRVLEVQATEMLQKLSRGRVVTGDPDGERWVAVAMPPDRQSWTEMLREQEDAGVNGVVVSWDARLVDLLRNPEPDDRSDLLMSTG